LANQLERRKPFYARMSVASARWGGPLSQNHHAQAGNIPNPAVYTQPLWTPRVHRLEVHRLEVRRRLRDVFQQHVTHYDMLVMLHRYVERFGYLPPSSRGPICRGKDLGFWMDDVRSNRNSLSAEFVAELEGTPGWHW
jgi:hypothetical protein